MEKQNRQPFSKRRACFSLWLLSLLFLTLSCRTIPDPRKTPPGVSLKVYGSRYNSIPAEFEVIVGAGYPSPGLISNVIPNTVKIEALAAQPGKALRAMRLIVDTPYLVDGCFKTGPEGKLETTAPDRTPVPVRAYEDALPGINPVGLMAIMDYNIYESYVRKFECPRGFSQGVTVTLIVEAKNVGDLTSRTPPLQLRFWR